MTDALDVLVTALPPEQRPLICRRVLPPARREILEVGIEILAQGREPFLSQFLAAFQARLEAEADPDRQDQLRLLLRLVSEHLGELADLRHRLLALKQQAMIHKAILAAWAAAAPTPTAVR